MESAYRFRKYGIPRVWGKGQTGACMGKSPEAAKRSADAKRAAASLQPPLPIASKSRDQAAIFTFSAAIATRFEIGWATSPASFSIVSVEREVSATIMSNALRT